MEFYLKKIVIPSLLILPIGILILVNYLYPLLIILSHSNNLVFGDYNYFFIITAYVCVIFTVSIERENLASWNLDRLALLILALAAFIRVKLHIPHETIYQNLIKLLGLALLGVCIISWKKIPQTSTRWTIIGILACVFVIPIAFIESTLVEKYATSNVLYQTKFVGHTITSLIYQLSFVAPFEEIVIRGVLWGQLRKWNIADSRIIWIQGILFWLLHISELATPITFFLSLPAAILIYSLLVKYSKQVFPSIVAHTLLNILVPIAVSYLF